jgi:hypothetical protein
MPLIKEIETALLEVAELPQDSQKDIAVMISRMVMVFDDSLTNTVREQWAQRDDELASFRMRFAHSATSATDRHPKVHRAGEPPSSSGTV